MLARLPRVPAGGGPAGVFELLAVRDLEFVDPARWPRALELLAGPPLRAALVEPNRVLLADGRYTDVPSYTAWWLRRHVTLAGRRPAACAPRTLIRCSRGCTTMAAAPPALADPAIARALGVRTSLGGLLTEPGGPDEL